MSVSQRTDVCHTFKIRERNPNKGQPVYVAGERGGREGR